MRFFVPALLALAFLAPAAAGGAGLVNVTLELRETHMLLPETLSCPVQVEAGADAGAVLDAATASGCIRGWDSQSDPQYGRYVTSINGKSESLGFYWAYFENGQAATSGIDFASADEGDVFGFAYADYATGIAVGMLPVTLP